MVSIESNFIVQISRIFVKVRNELGLAFINIFIPLTGECPEVKDPPGSETEPEDNCVDKWSTKKCNKKKNKCNKKKKVRNNCAKTCGVC